MIHAPPEKKMKTGAFLLAAAAGSAPAGT